MFHIWNQACRIIDFLGHLPNINPTWCWEQREGQRTCPHHVFVIRRVAFMIITPSLSFFSVVFTYQGFSSCNCTVDVGFVKLSSDCFCGNGVFKMNIKFCCHLCCSTSMIYRHNRLQFMAIPFIYFLVSRPLFLLADNVLPWFLYVIITLETAALNTPNKVAVWL